MRRAREAILSRGGGVKSQRVHARAARALRRPAVAQRAGDAGRDHAAAALVSVPPRQDFVLGAHRDRAAAGAAGAQAEGAQSARRHHRRTVSRGPANGRPRRQGAAPEMVVVPRASAASTSCCARSSRSCRRARASARSTRRSRSSPSGSTARTGSARSTRRWRTRVMMYRRARLSAGSSRSCDRARVDRQAARHQGGRGLLPALRLAGVGHGAGRPRAAGGRRREGGRSRRTAASTG